MSTDDLAERLSPLLPTLTHPGDADTPPFTLGGMVFDRSMLPPGMLQEDAEALGLPSPDFNRLVLEAIIHLLRDKGGVELVDKATLADLTAAAAVNEPRRNQQKQFRGSCGAPLFRAMVKDFDTDHPVISCDVLRAVRNLTPDCPHREA